MNKHEQNKATNVANANEQQPNSQQDKQANELAYDDFSYYGILEQVGQMTNDLFAQFLDASDLEKMKKNFALSKESVDTKEVDLAFNDIKMVTKRYKESLLAADKALPQVSAQEKNYLYELGVKHFTTGNYNDATLLFQFLVFIDGNNMDYLKSLAGSLQAKHDYHGAILYYIFAYGLKPQEQADCLFYAAVCAFELEDFDFAKQLFTFYGEDGNEQFIARSKLYLKSIDGALSKQETND